MKGQFIRFAVALVLAGLIYIVPWPLLRYGLGFVLVWVIPGLSWAHLIPHQALDRAERFAVGLGLNFVITPLLVLLLVYVPGPLPRASLLVAIVVVIGLPMLVRACIHLLRKRAILPAGLQVDGDVTKESLSNAMRHLWRSGWMWLLVALLIAAAMRSVNLGYSEFQGDEAIVMVSAARVLDGSESVVFQHKKGPAELTLVMAGWCLTGVTSEWMARLPFAWANVLGIAAVFLCGRRLGRPQASGIAACLLAIEGFLVGFGRIVQYQSLVFVLSALGMLCLLAYRARGRGSLVITAAALFAGGILAHYDAVLALPSGLLLIFSRLWLDRRRGWRVLVPMAVAALVGGMLLALFYVPFLRSSHWGQTSQYVAGRVGSDFYNHLWSSFELSAVYDSIYFLAIMVLALAGQMLVAWMRWNRIGFGLSGALIALAVTGLLWPDLWIVEQRTLAWIPFAVLLVGALLAPKQSVGTRSLWLWLGSTALFYLFFVALPLTHIHTAFSPWAMLVGMVLADAGRWLAGRSRAVLRMVGIAGVAIYVLCGLYTVMVFVDHTPEYRRTFPQSRHPLYWTPYEQIPEEGLFGFPYRAGWKVVGHLMNAGQLTGTYDSNEEREITDYYTRQAVRVHCASPDVYITAVNVQDEVPIRWDQIEKEYTATAIVTVNGQPKITVYERDALGQPVTYRAEEYDWLFDASLTPGQVTWPVLDGMEATSLEGYISHEAVLGDIIRLLGYKIDTRYAVPGGYVELTLFWQSLKPTSMDYRVFTHLHDGEEMRGQLDGQPVCDTYPTSQWQAGQLIVDPYRIPIKGDAPLGSVPLTVGMYDLMTMERLPVTLPDGAPAGDNVHLTDVTIREP